MGRRIRDKELSNTHGAGLDISVDTAAIKTRVTLIFLSLSREDVDTRNSTFLVRALREVDTRDLRELRQENPRRKKKKPAKRLPLQEMVSLDSDDSSRGIRSQESYHKKHPKPKVGGG